MADKNTAIQFHRWLSKYENGALDDELTALLADIASDVRLTGKGGALALTVKVTSQAQGVLVEASVRATRPKPKRTEFFYVTNAGLSRRDPAQPQLPTLEDSDQ